MNEALICRLCLYNNDDYVNIFSEKLRENKLQEKIAKHLGFEVKEDDNYPKLICIKCLQTIENFHSYYLEVSQNQSVFVYGEPLILAEATSQPIIIDQTHTTTFIIQETVQEVQDASVLTHPEYITNDPYGSNQTVIGIKIESFNPPSYEEVENSKHELTEIQVKNDEASTFIKERPKRTKKKIISDEYMETENSDDDSDYGDGSDVDNPQSDDEDDDNDDDDEKYSIGIEDKDGLFEGFPTSLIKDTKLLIRGKELTLLMSRFYRLECDLCTNDNKRVFKKLSSLCVHYNNAHSMKGYVICCGMKLVKMRAMALHMARHLQPDAFRCPECNKLMTCPKILQYHIQNHLPEEKRPLACPLCPRKFSYSSALVTHAISHQPEKDRTSHICDECGKTFSTPGRLSTHIAGSHTKHDQSFVCHVCAKQFTSKGNLAYHLTTHQPRIHQVQCEKCGKWLKNKLCLRKHMVQHSMVRHVCHLCDYSALNMQCLRNHMRVKHTDIKPFSCEVCGKTFKLKNTLMNHSAQHSGVKKFTCEFCSRTFASSGNYYSHRKRMHPTELATTRMQKEEEEKDFRQKTFLIEQKLTFKSSIAAQDDANQ